MLNTYNYIIRNYTEAGLYPEARAVQSRMRSEGYLNLEGKGVNFRTTAVLHRLSQCERGVLKRKDVVKQHRANMIDGRMMFVDTRRREWREPQAVQRQRSVNLQESIPEQHSLEKSVP